MTYDITVESTVREILAAGRSALQALDISGYEISVTIEGDLGRDVKTASTLYPDETVERGLARLIAESLDRDLTGANSTFISLAGAFWVKDVVLPQLLAGTEKPLSEVFNTLATPRYGPGASFAVQQTPDEVMSRYAGHRYIAEIVFNREFEADWDQVGVPQFHDFPLAEALLKQMAGELEEAREHGDFFKLYTFTVTRMMYPVRTTEEYTALEPIEVPRKIDPREVSAALLNLNELAAQLTKLGVTGELNALRSQIEQLEEASESTPVQSVVTEHTTYGTPVRDLNYGF